MGVSSTSSGCLDCLDFQSLSLKRRFHPNGGVTSKINHICIYNRWRDN